MIPTTSERRALARAAWTLVGAIAIGGCVEAPPSPPPPGPEPTEALRPEALRGPIPPTARVVDYVLHARYDAPQHEIEGQAHITWHNRGSTPVDRIPFHLYMNGFRASDTVWMNQARGSHRANPQDPEHPWGFIDVARVEQVGVTQDQDGAPSRTPVRFAEHDEPSLMTVWLDQAIPAGGSTELHLTFVTRLPHAFARTGFDDQYVMAGQWFPKPGVRERDGRWRTHPFSLYSEFYADFGHYDVELDLPGDLVVGASGILVSREIDGDRQRLRYRAEMVHDFAWTAGPDLVEFGDDYEGIRIRALLPSDRIDDAPAHLEAQRAALQSMEARFGPYPWSTITVVDPPSGAKGAGGMEYPTFYTTSPILSLPAWVRALGFDTRVGGYFTTIHEFGHQYFQGLLASDEFSQPWLDEGLNTFSNTLVAVDAFGHDGGDGPWVIKIAGLPLNFYDGLRLSGVSLAPMQPIDQSAIEFTPLVGEYSANTYSKTAVTMHTARRLVGPARFDSAMRAYTERFRFRHPTGEDLERTLIAALAERVPLGRDPQGNPIELSLDAFFEQAMRTTRVVDFRVHRVLNRPQARAEGWYRDETGTLVGGEPRREPPDEGWADEDLEAIVVVHRRGEFEIPVVIEAEFTDDSRDRVLWDGTGRYRIFEWPGRRLRRATIDPDHHLLLERRRADNTQYAADEAPPVTVSRTFGNLSEASALALGGVLGP